MAVIALTIAVNSGSFLLLGALLHWWFHRDPARARAWRHQPDKGYTRALLMKRLPLVLFNAVLLNGIVGFGLWRAFSGNTQAYWDPLARGVPYLMLSTAAIFLFYHCLLFYVHKAMHQPVLFRAVHHLHHRYKAPLWLDALHEHPVEAVYGGLVVIAPLFLFPVNVWAYLLFIVIMGAHEIIDHSGINLNIPLLAKSVEHDLHHLRSNGGYGQLLGLLDWVHGTSFSSRARTSKR
jgi:sterol desaturase/sphingolipid hydroxylase (fatty acid hydroxylase superfamily)